MDYSNISLADARRDYLAGSTTAMPIAGFLAWLGLACAAAALQDRLPSFLPFVAAAIPFPLALLIDRIRGVEGIKFGNRRNPVTQLFMQFIAVVALLTPFVIFAAREAQSIDMLILGMAILAGMVWVPHGWGADDPAGLRHFIMRALLCYAAYLTVPEPMRGAGVAGAAALTYVYAIVAMRKPSSVQRVSGRP